MSTTLTHTTAATFTHTSARYLVSKVAADLRQMQLLHRGTPSESDIAAYIEELVTLLAGGYVSSVEYGFKRDGDWVAALRYVVNFDGTVISADDRPGRVPLGNIQGAGFGSFMVKSRKWFDLSSEKRKEIERTLPFIRTIGTEPGGSWAYGQKTYSRDGVSLRRGTIGQ